MVSSEAAGKAPASVSCVSTSGTPQAGYRAALHLFWGVPMSKSPLWFPVYVTDYLADTYHLTTEGHGAYLLLMFHYWRQGGLPTDDAGLARIARLGLPQWMAIRDTIFEFFDADWRHGRIDAELKKSNQIISERSHAGKAGARARWGAKGGKPNGKRMAT